MRRPICIDGGQVIGTLGLEYYRSLLICPGLEAEITFASPLHCAPAVSSTPVTPLHQFQAPRVTIIFIIRRSKVAYESRKVAHQFGAYKQPGRVLFPIPQQHREADRRGQCLQVAAKSEPTRAKLHVLDLHQHLQQSIPRVMTSSRKVNTPQVRCCTFTRPADETDWT